MLGSTDCVSKRLGGLSTKIWLKSVEINIKYQKNISKKSVFFWNFQINKSVTLPEQVYDKGTVLKLMFLLSYLIFLKIVSEALDTNYCKNLYVK